MQYRTSVLYLTTNPSQAGRVRKTYATYKTNSIFTLVLRRLDLNARPPGYEPGELPAAPLRDKLLARPIESNYGLLWA